MPLEFLPHIRNYFRQERMPELADSPQPLLPEHTSQPDFLAEKQSVQLPTLELHEEKTHEQLSDEQLAEEVQKVLDGLLNEQNNERLFLSETVKEYAEPKHTAPESKESPKKKDVGEIAWFENQIFKSEQQELEAKRQYNEVLNEVRGELPEVSISEDAEHLRLFEQKMGERDVLGREVISQLKEKIDTPSVEELRALTDKTAEFVLSEGEAWEEVISLVEKQKERHPERVEEIEAHSNALEKEAEAQKNLIPLTEEWLNVQDSAELARVANSSYSVENFLAQHALLSEKEKENLKELVGVLADNQLEENSLLGQALSLEDFQERLREKQTEYLEKASQYPALADRLLLFAQKKFQVSTDFAMVRMALDACVKEVQSSASTSSSEEASVSTPKFESVQSEKIEEEEEEVGSATTPSSEDLPKNPQMEAAQEELKRLEQRKLELQKILESQWQSGADSQESGLKSAQ